VINRQLIFALPALLILSGCLRTSTTRSASQPSSTEGSGNKSAYAEAAARVTDACTLMPADLVQKIVPGAGGPQSSQYPKRCSVSNGKSVLEITIETGIITPTDPINGAEFISGLAAGGYLERLDPVSRGDTYLTVILGKDPNGLLHVEVAGHDGKDHKDDAIAVARAILARLR
jgi:hypothetical protein